MTHHSNRLPWIDTAKGVSILLVVFWHVLLLAKFAAFTPEEIYRTINSPLLLIRMPLFFFISGFLLSRSIHTFLEDFILNKIMPLVWTYTIWTLIYTVAQGRDAFYLISSWWSPQLHLWFVLALILYRILGYLLQRFSLLAILVALIVCVVFSHPLVFGGDWLTTIQQRIPKNAFYFLTGCWFGQFLFPWIGRLPWFWGSIGSGLAATFYAFDVEIGVAIGGVLAGLSLSVIITTYFEAISRILSFFGRHSLEIFLIHFGLVTASIKIFSFIYMPNILITPCATLLSATLPIAIRAASDRLFPWLFVMPRFPARTRERSR